MPRVSVIIPALNAAECIEHAVCSVLTQTKSDFELLIVDDGSRDATLEKTQAFADRDKRVRVVSHSTRRGVSAARNTGLRLARGRWIAFLDADDLWLRNSLEIRLSIADENPECAFISTDFIQRPYASSWADDINIHNKRLGLSFFRNRELTSQLLSDAFQANQYIRLTRPVREFLTTSLAYTDTTMIKRNLLEKIGGFEVRLHTGEDIHCWIRLAAHADLYFSPEVTAVCRLRPNSLTRQPTTSPLEGGVEACQALLKSEELRAYRREIKRKMASFYQQNCMFYRQRGLKKKALINAIMTYRAGLFCPGAFRNLIATMLGR